MSWDFDYPSGVPYLDAGDITDLDGKGVLSFHSWCRLEADISDHAVFGKYDGTNGMRMFFDLLGLNSKAKIPTLIVTVGGTSVRAEGGTDNVFTKDVWHSFGGFWKPNDAAGIKVYLDGVEEGSGSTTAQGGSTTFPNITANLFVGKRGGPVGQIAWDGKISESAIWDEELTPEEWKALAAGVPAYTIRPWALIFWTGMLSTAANEWFWRPKAGVTADFTHSSSHVYYSQLEPPAGAAPYWQEEQEEFSPAASYSSWEKIADPVELSEYLDTGLTNGVEYQYYVKAVDTSGNPSSPSATESVTPSGSASGPPLVPPYPSTRKRIPMMQIMDEEELL